MSDDSLAREKLGYALNYYGLKTASRKIQHFMDTTLHKDASELREKRERTNIAFHISVF